MERNQSSEKKRFTDEASLDGVRKPAQSFVDLSVFGKTSTTA